jgi:exosortase A-associated hydrolase 1
VVTVPRGDQALVFDCEGEQLVGVVSGAGIAAVGLVIIVGGPQYRIGSHRQFVLLGRRLAQAGIPVMRFDYRGMGDSTGEMRSFEHVVPDITAALAAFRTARPSLERVVLWGLCDAASACLIYWQKTHDPRVAGLILADPWITSHEAFAQSQVRHYLRRPFQRAFWAKVFGGGIDFGGALRDFVAVLSKTRHKTSSPAPAAEMSFQEMMTRGMESFDAPIMLVLSGDLTARDFRGHCQTHPQWQRLIGRRNVEQREIPDANHTFATAASRAKVESLTIDWLRRVFGIHA